MKPYHRAPNHTPRADPAPTWGPNTAIPQYFPVGGSRTLSYVRRTDRAKDFTALPLLASGARVCFLRGGPDNVSCPLTAAQGPEQLTPKGRRSRPFPLCTRPPSGHFAPLMAPSAPRSRCPSVEPPRARQSLRRHARRHDLWRERHICQTCQRAAGSGCSIPIPLPMQPRSH